MLKRTFGAASIALLATPVLCQCAIASPAVEDLTFGETLTNTCPADCSSVVLATDPLDGVNTVEYIFDATIPNVNAGDIKIQEFGGTTVGDVIRFENLAGIGAVAFIYSADLGGGLAADVGVPGVFQANTLTVSEDSTGFAGPIAPTRSQPGYCGSCAATLSYGLESPDIAIVAIPEPGTFEMFGAGLLSLWGFGRVRRRG